MEKAIAALIKTFPGLLVTWIYPWLAKPILLPYKNGLPTAVFICERLVASFTSPPETIPPNTDVPELAFALTVSLLLQAQGIKLTPAELGPLMIGLGQRGLSDPDLQVG